MNANEHKQYNITWLLSQAPYLFDSVSKNGIKFYEHPTHGDEYPVIAVLDGIAWDTGFYDPWNNCDQAYIEEQAQELGLISPEVDVWNY